MDDVKWIMNNKLMDPEVIAKYLLDTNQEKEALLYITSKHCCYSADTYCSVVDALLKGLIEKGTLHTLCSQSADNFVLRLIDYDSYELFELVIKYDFGVQFDNDLLLEIAAKKCNPRSVKVLLDNGADVNANDGAALCACIDNVGVHVTTFACFTLGLLLESGAHVEARNNYALKRTIESGEIKTFKLLIKHGAKMQRNDIEQIIFNVDMLTGCHISMLQILMVEDPSFLANDEIFYRAIERNKRDLVELFIKNNFNVNTNKHAASAALNFAINEGATQIVKLLIKRGVNISDCDIIFDEAKYEQMDIVLILIEAGVDISMGDNFMARCAAKYWRSDVIKELINRGLNIADLDTDTINKINYMLA